MSEFNRSRRQFAAQVAKTAGFLALSLGKGREARAAQTAVANPDPRFFINIHNRGGADSMWFHNYSTSADLSASLGGNATAVGNSYVDRFNPSLAIQHPSNPNYLMGIGMSMFNASDYANMAIWRGISPDGSHDIGNRIIQCGQFTNYAAGFSSLISMALAQTSAPLPLHYAEAAASQSAAWTWPGLLSGYAIPVNLPNAASFAGLTSFLPNELVPSSRLQMVSSAIQAISAATDSVGFRLSSSKSYFDSFLASYQGMTQVYGTGMGSSAAFLAIIAAYQTAAINALNNFYNTYGSSVVNASPSYGNHFQGAFGSLGSDMAVPLTGALTFAGIASTALGQNIAQAAYSFALAEYLVINGLSRVIDVGPFCLNFDGHSDNGSELVNLLVKYSMLQAIIRRMGNAAITGTVPGTASHNYLQHATIVMTTEFDRTPFVDEELSGTYPGTNHGATASVIMAGRGVNVGKVFGDWMPAQGAYGKYAAFASAASYAGPLPVDPVTGAPSPSGVIWTSKAIFNTVMAIFGVAIPGEQITGAVPFAPIISGS